MTHITLIAAAIAGLTLTAPATFAGNAGATLGACYNHVISACNQTNHPAPCSESGMGTCDDLHNANVAPGTRSIKLLKSGGRTPVYKFLFTPIPSANPQLLVRR